MLNMDSREGLEGGAETNAKEPRSTFRFWIRTPLHKMSDTGKRRTVLCALVAMVITWHGATTYFEERLFKSFSFVYPFFLVWCMCLLYCLLYLTFLSVTKNKKGLHALEVLYQGSDRSLRSSVIWLCALYIVSNSLSKMALEYVSIPTQIVFKSCKLVAVMVGSSFILGKTYSIWEYLIAVALVATPTPVNLYTQE